jgi:predicted DNA-binding transcriptional regulator YafY
LISTAAKLAAEYNVSPATIKRDAKFAEAVDELAKNVGKEVKVEILSGRSGLTKKEVVEIASEPEEKQVAAVESAKLKSPNGSAVKTDVEKLIDGIEGLIEKVNVLAARRMGHNDQSRSVVATLKEAVRQSKAMAKSWRNV